MGVEAQNRSDGVVASISPLPAAEDTAVEPLPPKLADEYREREKRLLGQIEQTLHYYNIRLRACRKTQRIISIAVMVGGTLAPVIVAGTVPGNATSYFNISTSWLSVAGVVITMVLAMLEGLRRIYRPDQQWANCYTAKTAVYRARDKYLLHQIGNKVGCGAWLDNLVALSFAYESAIDKEASEFFAGLRAGRSDDKSKDASATQPLEASAVSG